MFNTNFFNVADFLKIGIMALLFLALAAFAFRKIGVKNPAE